MRRCEDEKMFYRPPLLEEPCAQTLSGKKVLTNHNLFVKHTRYVDNRLIFGDARLQDLSPYEVLLDEGFYGKPIGD